MTIFFPDISSYETGLVVQPGTVAVIAKATEGTYYRDALYATFKAQASQVGAVFSAYHFLKAGNGAAQADYCHAMVGDTPVMLDVETEGTSKPTVADCLAFITRMRALGGRVWAAYFPRWYWEQVGGNLASLGVAIVASGYPGHYSDTDPNWLPYGGVSPLIWQYTNAQPYGGQRVDFNAYRGTVPQLAALISGTSTSGEDMALDSTDVRALWSYSNGDKPDVHQTLANAAANSATAVTQTAQILAVLKQQPMAPDAIAAAIVADLKTAGVITVADPAAIATAVVTVLEQHNLGGLSAQQMAEALTAAAGALNTGGGA